MIAFEDLCQALERYNRRRRNQEEMAELDHAAPPAAAVPVAAVERTDEAVELPAFDDESAEPISLDDLGADVVPMDGEPTQLSAMPEASDDERRD